MKGEVVYLYAFDVANEIITVRVEEILSEKPFPFEIRMDRTLPKDMPLYKPLAIEPRPLATRFRGQPVHLLSPLVPSTYLLVGLAKVEFADHQKFTLKWAIAISMLLMIGSLLFGLYPLAA